MLVLSLIQSSLEKLLSQVGYFSWKQVLNLRQGYDLSSYPDVIGKWNQANTLMWEQCKQLGPQFCLPVHYEHLVLEKEKVLRSIGK